MSGELGATGKTADEKLGAGRAQAEQGPLLALANLVAKAVLESALLYDHNRNPHGSSSSGWARRRSKIGRYISGLSKRAMFVARLPASFDEEPQ